MAEMRTLILELRPESLANEGLVWRCENWRRRRARDITSMCI